MPLYSRHKVGPAPSPPVLSATSNIPNVGGLVQNMNDLSARTNANLDAGSQNSSNYSADPPDSLAPTWPAGSISQRVKKLSWDDDDRVILFLYNYFILNSVKIIDNIYLNSAKVYECHINNF